MKYLIPILLSLSSTALAQTPLSYQQVLKSAPELQLADSITIGVNDMTGSQVIDPATGAALFRFRYPGNLNNWQNPTTHYLLGKISSHKDYDLLFVKEENTETESRDYDAVYIFTFSKDGTYIAFIAAAMNSVTEKSKHVTYCQLYKDLKIIQHINLTLNSNERSFLAEYRVNDYGGFVYYPKY